MKERGMMKWKPFISMVEQQQSVYQVLQDIQKINKPLLDESQHEENSHLLLSAYYSHQRVQILYYEQGYLKQYRGEIYKINEAYRYFVLLDEKRGTRRELAFDGVIKVSGESW